MKKFIAAFDGLKFSESTRDYAVSLAKQNSAHLVGVFLDDFTYNSFKLHDLLTEEGGYSEAKHRTLKAKDEKTRDEAVKNFEEACHSFDLNYSIHHDRSVAIQELIHESIYADLLIVDRSETLTHYEEKIPTEFIQDVLLHAQCPVMVVPQVFKPVDKLILLYNGEPSSVQAIKMLSYTLASVKHFPSEVVSVNNPKQSLHVPDNRLMKEFMKRHFPAATYKVLKGDAEVEIINYLREQTSNSLVVLGAYQRSMVSRWFRASMADTLMKEVKLPLFIAHNK
jgi:hypothetical protein